MASLSGLLLREVYGVLSAELEHPVYDQVPETATAPYAVLGEVTETEADAHDRAGVDATLTVHVWSRYRGYREAAELVGEIDAALHRRPLPLAGFRDVSIAATGHQFMRDPDPDLRHALTRFRIWATETPPAPEQDPDDEPADTQEV